MPHAYRDLVSAHFLTHSHTFTASSLTPSLLMYELSFVCLVHRLTDVCIVFCMFYLLFTTYSTTIPASYWAHVRVLPFGRVPPEPSRHHVTQTPHTLSLRAGDPPPITRTARALGCMGTGINSQAGNWLSFFLIGKFIYINYLHRFMDTCPKT